MKFRNKMELLRSICYLYSKYTKFVIRWDLDSKLVLVEPKTALVNDYLTTAYTVCAC
jgi:hypothetical protein